MFLFYAALCVIVVWAVGRALIGAWRGLNAAGFAMILLALACIVMTCVSVAYSTLPSSAPRRTMTGTIPWVKKHRQGRNSFYTVGFQTEDGESHTFEAATTPLPVDEQDKVAITCLDEERAEHYPRIIKFRALTGTHAGETSTVNADWFGAWIGVWLFPGLAFAALLGAVKHPRRDQSPA